MLALAELLGYGKPADPRLLLRTVKDRREKYGRYLGTFLKPIPEGGLLDINAEMVRLGHATVYNP